MDRIYIQLDEGKNLREESEVKTELLDSLRNARVEKSTKNEQGNLELAWELHAMSEEICELRKLYGEVQSSLHRKDLLVDQISSANGKLETECNEKLLKLEGVNRDLVLSLDEAFARIRDLEKKTASSSEEISDLKRLLSKTNKNVSIDQKEIDEYILKLEEENGISRDQLRWKNEQFSRLEEAHEKIKSFFKESESEWQKERLSLLGEISSLQSVLNEEELSYKALKLELQKSESEVETLKLNLGAYQLAHEQERIGLLAAVNDKDAKIGDLEQQISMLKSVNLAKSEVVEMLAQEKDSYVRLAEDRNCSIKNLQNEIAELRNKLAEREVTNIAILDANETISLARNEMYELREKSLLQSAQVALRPEETKKSEIQELRSQLENETRCFEDLLKELESHKHALLDDRTKEKVNRGNLIAQLENMCRLIGFLCAEDAELTKLSLLREEDGESDKLINTFSPSRKRTPLAELNVSSL